MLDRCASGHQRLATEHYWRVTYGERTYPTFPRGEHGRRVRVEIQLGHVRKMSRHLGILDCAKQQLEQLR